MSARHALLGLLLHRSAYPYELADRLLGRLGPAWAINSGQLYQTIRALEREGLIERIEDPSDGRESRQTFRISGSGVEEFERWFEEANAPTRLSRRSLMVKITLAGPQRIRDALEQIDAYERECAERLREVVGAREAITIQGPQVRADHVLLRLSLSADIIQLEGESRWARHAHEMVSWLLGQEAIWPSARERSSPIREEPQWPGPLDSVRLV